MVIDHSKSDQNPNPCGDRPAKSVRDWWDSHRRKINSAIDHFTIAKNKSPLSKTSQVMKTMNTSDK
jgi:hypothetical protein